VELDLVLENDVCVQGGSISGQLCVHVRRRTKREGDIMISRGKLRLVGFETLGGQHDRHVFYQTAVSMSDASERSDAVLDSQEDLDGFAWAKTGDHLIPFSMQVPLEGDVGNAKGVLDTQAGGASVRYIIMITVKVKDPATDARSIAHFYRDCEVWPRLNPSAILAPAPRPISDSSAKSLFMGGSGKVYLTASLHRVHWIAGQKCYIRIGVSNGSKKTIKRVTIALVRTLVAFKPNSKKDEDDDPDACSATSYEKQIAETSLEMCELGSRGHASAKGWWTGVMPDEDKEFSHFIQIPPDALTIPRGRLLEVEYTLRVSISSGSLSSDITVKVPLRIINFLSVDPPPSAPAESASMSRGSSAASGPILAYEREDNYGQPEPGSRHAQIMQGPGVDGEAGFLPHRGSHVRPALPGMFQHGAIPEQDEGARGPASYPTCDFKVHPPGTEDEYSDEFTDPDSSGFEDEEATAPRTGLANLSMRDDSDDVVQYAVSAASQDYSNQTDNGSLETSTIQAESEADEPAGFMPYTRTTTCAPSAITFSDLYYENPINHPANDPHGHIQLRQESIPAAAPAPRPTVPSPPGPRAEGPPRPNYAAHAQTLAAPPGQDEQDMLQHARRHSYSDTPAALRPGGARERVGGRPAFALRVQEKLQARGSSAGPPGETLVAHGFDELPGAGLQAEQAPPALYGMPGGYASSASVTGDGLGHGDGDGDAGEGLRTPMARYTSREVTAEPASYAIQPSRPLAQGTHRAVSPSPSYVAETREARAEGRGSRLLPTPPASATLPPGPVQVASRQAAESPAPAEPARGRARSYTTSVVPPQATESSRGSASPSKGRLAQEGLPTSISASPQKGGLSSVQERIRQLEERSRAGL
ncbi:hypothetical protein HDZ31DRAFT_47171, partial [Schizophyllum fasciatum]